MSYILDALRKADAQRERDPARGIHAQALPPSALAQPDGRGLPGWAVPAAGAGLVLVAVGAWWTLHDRAPAPASAPAPVQATAPSVQPAAPPQAAPAVSIAPAAPVQPPVAAAAPPAAPRQMTLQEMNRSVPPMRGTPPTPGVDPNRAPAAIAQPGPVPAPRSGPAMGMAPPPHVSITGTPPAAAPLAGAAPQAAPAGSEAPKQANAGLPADAPKVAISGGVYSSDPTQRMLIVNGQVYNEGSELAPGVRLAEIKARTAVLEFRGARYSVAY